MAECPICSQPVPDGASHCPECGATLALDGAEAPAEPGVDAAGDTLELGDLGNLDDLFSEIPAETEEGGEETAAGGSAVVDAGAVESSGAGADGDVGGEGMSSYITGLDGLDLEDAETARKRREAEEEARVKGEEMAGLREVFDGLVVEVRGIKDKGADASSFKPLFDNYKALAEALDVDSCKTLLDKIREHIKDVSKAHQKKMVDELVERIKAVRKTTLGLKQSGADVSEIKEMFGQVKELLSARDLDAAGELTDRLEKAVASIQPPPMEGSSELDGLLQGLDGALAQMAERGLDPGELAGRPAAVRELASSGNIDGAMSEAKAALNEAGTMLTQPPVMVPPPMEPPADAAPPEDAGDGAAGDAAAVETGAEVAGGEVAAEAATGEGAAEAATGEGAAEAATGEGAAEAAAGEGAAEAAAGEGAAEAAAGEGAAEAATGEGAAEAATGEGAAEAAAGEGAAEAATGEGAAEAAAGEGAAEAATGEGAAEAATGEGAAEAATGEGAAEAATGEGAAEAAAGEGAAEAAAGEGAAEAAAGEGAAEAATGEGAAEAATGEGAAEAATGEDTSVAGPPEAPGAAPEPPSEEAPGPEKMKRAMERADAGGLVLGDFRSDLNEIITQAEEKAADGDEGAEAVRELNDRFFNLLFKIKAEESIRRLDDMVEEGESYDVDMDPVIDDLTKMTDLVDDGDPKGALGVAKEALSRAEELLNVSRGKVKNSLEVRLRELRKELRKLRKEGQDVDTQNDRLKTAKDLLKKDELAQARETVEDINRFISELDKLGKTGHLNELVSRVREDLELMERLKVDTSEVRALFDAATAALEDNELEIVDRMLNRAQGKSKELIYLGKGRIKQEAADNFARLPAEMEELYVVTEFVPNMSELEDGLKKCKELLNAKEFLESYEESARLLDKISLLRKDARKKAREGAEGMLEQLGILIVDKGGLGADISEIKVKFAEAKDLMDKDKVLDAYTLAKLAKEALEAQGVYVPDLPPEPVNDIDLPAPDGGPEAGAGTDASIDTAAGNAGEGDDGPAAGEAPDVGAEPPAGEAARAAGPGPPDVPAVDGEDERAAAGPSGPSGAEEEDGPAQAPAEGAGPEAVPAEEDPFHIDVPTDEEEGGEEEPAGAPDIPGLKLVKKSESSKKLMDRIEKMRSRVIAEHEAAMGPHEAKEALMKIKAQLVEAKNEGVNVAKAEEVFRAVQPILRAKEFDKAVKTARQALKLVNEERRKMYEGGGPDVEEEEEEDAEPEPEPAPAPAPAPEPAAPPSPAPAPSPEPQGPSAGKPMNKKEELLMKKAQEELAEANRLAEEAKAAGRDISKAQKYLSLVDKAVAENNFKKMILIARKAKDALGG